MLYLLSEIINMADETQYITSGSLDQLKKELETIKNKTILDIAKRIDEAKQQGDLSENAEYHQAREDMSWAQGRARELEHIIDNAQIIKTSANNDVVSLGSTITVEVNNNKREFTIVGPQEANPSSGHISNESPLGHAFLGAKIGEKVAVVVPSGKQVYQILAIK